MVNEGNHPQMALIQVSELLQFTQIMGISRIFDNHELSIPFAFLGKEAERLAASVIASVCVSVHFV